MVPPNELAIIRRIDSGLDEIEEPLLVAGVLMCCNTGTGEASSYGRVMSGHE